MSPPSFVSLGLATPLGLSSRTTQVAIAGGLTGFVETDAEDRAGERVRASRVATLEDRANREDRMLFMGQRALLECASVIGEGKAGPTNTVIAYVALPERDARRFDDSYVMRGLRTASAQLPIDWSAPPIRAGRAGLFFALNNAVADLGAGRCSAALIGGIDSNADRDSLSHYIERGRILGPHNPDGLIPGEGAGFVLVAPGGTWGAALGRLLSNATARDSAGWDERSPMIAQGLTSVFRQLRHANAGQPRPNRIYSSQTAESFWFRELNNAYLRNGDVMPEPFKVTKLAESLGDAGAAAPVIELGMAFHDFEHSHRRALDIRRALVYGAADEGAVGGCIVSKSA